MGKGSNASKINRARAEAAKKASEEKAGGGGSKGMAARKGTDALTLQCSICKAAFLSTQSKVQLTEHADSKHPKASFAECFPSYTA